MPTAPPLPRVLYRGGSIYSPADPFATAMLVDGAHVAWVGSDDAAASQLAGFGPRDAVVDLDGALVTPAFVDAHVHVTETGLGLTELDLSSAPSLACALDAVAEAAAARPGEAVSASGWDESAWPEGRAPTMAEVDRAAGGASVYLARADVHSAVVSSALAQRLSLAGMTGWSPQGLVSGEAHHAARGAARDLPAGQRAAVQARALATASAAGIGCVHECSAPHVGSAADLASLLSVAGEVGASAPQVLFFWGELACEDAELARILGALALDGHDAPRARAFLGLGGDLTVDGSIGSRTAAFHAPYTDADRGGGPPTATSGILQLSAAQVRDHVVTCTRARLAAGFHVIGDAAVDAALEGFSLAAEVLGQAAVSAGGHRLEHVEAIDAAGIAVMARLGITASVQPAFDARWGAPGGMYARRLGARRAAGLNPFAALAAAGVPLAFGSDSPVTPFAPWEAVRAAAFTHVAEHRTSVRAAFLASTRGGWRAAGHHGGGVLAPGAAATFAVWEPRDLLVQTPDERVTAWSTDARSGTPGLPDLTPGAPAPLCLRTVVGGRATHDVDGWTGAQATAC